MVREWGSIHRDELAANWSGCGFQRSHADRTAAMNAPRTTITEVEPLAERCVRLTFGDGAIHEVDLADLLEAGGVFTAIRDDRKLFEAVAVDHEFGTIVWPGDIDLDPDVLRGDKAPASGPALPRRIFSPPELRRPTGTRRCRVAREQQRSRASTVRARVLLIDDSSALAKRSFPTREDGSTVVP